MAIANRITGWLLRKLRLQIPVTSLSIGELKNIEYDKQLTQVLSRCLKPDLICIDGGANKGNILREMCRLAPKGSHHAFEPIPVFAERLRIEFPQSRIHQTAIADYFGNSTFKYVRNAPAYSGLKKRTYDHDNPKIEDINVDVVRLEDIISDSESIDFIKLDLEGGEYHAMKGAVSLIRRCQPIIVFEAGQPSSSYYGVSPEMIFSFVSETLNYSISTMKLWLENEPPFTKNTYIENYPLDFNYIIYASQ